MTIHILDTNDLSVIGLVHDYKTFSLTLNYSKIGDFVISIDNRIENAKLFIKDRIVMFENNGFRSGIVTHISIEIDDDGEELRTIKGKTLGHILSFRVTNAYGTNEFNFENGHVETVIKQYVNKNAVSPTDEKRKIDNLIIAGDEGAGRELRWQTKFDCLSDVVEEIAEMEEMGWYIKIDEELGILIFDTYQGKDLSNDVVFSTHYGNLESQSYTYDEYTHKNFAYVAGEIFDLEVKTDKETGEVVTETETIIKEHTGEVITIEKPKERRIYQVGDLDARGLNRKETFIEVNESKDEYIDIPELGKRELESMTELESIEVKIMKDSIFKYGVDYNLGDIVSVYDNDWGLAKTLRITSITIEVSENEDHDISITFGNVLPLLGDRIKQELKSYKPYTKR